MRVHHLNIGAMQPFGGALFDGQTASFGGANLTCHCLLVEAKAGLVLVDTGTVGHDAVASGERLHPFFRAIDRVRLVPAEAAVQQIRRLGYDSAAVKHVVMTHLDFDHAAGLADFPGARVHLSQAEAEAARDPGSARARARYRPAQWGDPSRWTTYGNFSDHFYGVPATRLDGIEGFRLVWLPGHTPGHCGVAIDQDDGNWLLHAADAIFNLREIDPEDPRTPTGARLYQWLMETSQVQRRRSLAHLRRLREEHDHIQIICTHDPAAFPATEQPVRSGRA